MYISKNNNKSNILEFSTVLMIVANFGSVFSVILAKTVWIITFVLCFIQIVRCRAIILPQLVLVNIIVWIIAILSSLLTNTDITLYKEIFIGSLLASMVIMANRYRFDRIKNHIYLSCKLLCLLGFLNFLLYSFAPFLFKEVVDVIGYKTTTILYIFNYEDGDFYIRNRGFFWEPGVFQIVLNIYLFLILIEKKEPFRKAFLPILTILSTFSTTGYVIMVLIIMYHYFRKRVEVVSFKHVFFSISFLLILSSFMYINIENKINSTTSQSAALRTYDQLMGMTIILKNPIIGVGIDSKRYINKAEWLDLGYYDVNALDIERGNTNTILLIGMAFGLPVLFLFLFSIYKQRIFLNNRLFFILFLMMISSEPVIGFPLLFLINMSCIKFAK